jgi:ribosomal-protein-alanine N-acetyltransferase
MKTSINESIRWLIRRDMDDVMQIDDVGYVEPWSESKFISTLRKKTVIGVVATNGFNRTIGFCLYELQKTQIEILRMAVSPQWRRKGVASAMIDRLKDKVANQKRCGVACEVDGHSIFSQLCFRDNGFTGHAIADDKILFLWERGQ